MPEDATALSPDEVFVSAYELSGFSHKIKTVVKRLFEKHGDYIELHRKHKRKTLINIQEESFIKTMLNSYMGTFFSYGELKGSELKYQLKVEFSFLDTPIKAIMDLVSINKEKKQVRAIDIKTTSSELKDFQFSILKYSYFRQATLYELALKSFYEDFEVLPTKFLVISKKTMDCKLIDNPYTEEEGLHGVSDKKGIVELIEEYKSINEDDRIIEKHQ